ncbi:hypothetical protein THAOC_27556 [Thalassiosira oceanica]|uniref:Uncharacterized protein n=1 Tax=Thalassiosira oceanica TaxID=159749 RepID=K0S2D4_THAOC|nr:hypothetical protein THAOC_27556 [Thalassiosira oceanica]|eukprot:EJK53072.1 hypothetical protein THAOC_27556 [Thalassiosira oceanica]
MSDPFMRDYSRALAEALREKEVNLTTGTGGPSDVDKIRSCYVELCHDDPLVTGGDAYCHLLSKALTPKRKKKEEPSTKDRVALCSRLVDGVLQAVTRAAERTTAASAATTSSSTANGQSHAASPNEQQDAIETMFGLSNVTTAEGYAELAFVIFIRSGFWAPSSPLVSLTLRVFLADNEKSRLAEEATANIVEGMEKIGTGDDEHVDQNKRRDDGHESSSSSEFFHRNESAAAPSPAYGESSSLAEVFASDSDDSDFDYGGSYEFHTPISPKCAGQDEDFGFDPTLLSKPNEKRTWDDATGALHYLLSHASYTKLALSSLSSRKWNGAGISESLADLVFLLLVKDANRDGKTDQCSLLSSRPGAADIPLLWSRVLCVLQDRALDRNRGHDALPCYLQLLSGLILYTDQSIASILHTSGDDPIELVATTKVGLSSFANICSCKEMTDAGSGKMAGTTAWSVCPRDEVRKSLIEAMDLFGQLVEIVNPHNGICADRRKNIVGEGGMSGSPAPWSSIIPMLEYLMNLRARHGFVPLFDGGGNSSYSLSKAHAKEISSDLFRELLSTFVATGPQGGTPEDGPTEAEQAVRMELLRTLLGLSIQSLDLMGRYAVRVPGFAGVVHSSAFMEEHPVDGILWSAMANSKLAAASASAARAEDGKSLAERSLEGFATMCESSRTALERLSALAKDPAGASLDASQRRRYGDSRAALGDLIGFGNCLSNCPSASAVWLDSLANHGGAAERAAVAVGELRSLLAAIPSSFADDEGVASDRRRGHKKDDDGERSDGCEDEASSVMAGKDAAETRRMRRDYAAAVASVRSSVKIVALALGSRREGGGCQSSPARRTSTRLPRQIDTRYDEIEGKS